MSFGEVQCSLGVQQGFSFLSQSENLETRTLIIRDPSLLMQKPVDTRILHSFRILLCNDDSLEFFADTNEDQRKWMNVLELVLMFPNSCIPQEPSACHIQEYLTTNLNPNDYNSGKIRRGSYVYCQICQLTHSRIYVGSISCCIQHHCYIFSHFYLLQTYWLKRPCLNTFSATPRWIWLYDR